jgi:ADP-heptose:LPS heptosyltransferase
MIRILAQNMGLGNQIQFIPVIKALLKNGMNVISDSSFYKDMDILKEVDTSGKKKPINLVVFGYDWKNVLKLRLKYRGDLFGFKYRIKGKIIGIGYTKALDFDPSKTEVENNMQILKLLGIEDTEIDYNIDRVEPLQKNWIALGISNKNGKKYLYWEDLANLLKKDGFKVYAFGDYKIDNCINPPTPTLLDLRKWLSKMEFFIGSDSGIMHLADAMKIPTIAMFGATHTEKNKPYNKPNVVLRPKIECAPCYGIWGSVNCFQDPKYQCMLYSPDEVYDKFYKLKNSVD